MRLSAPVPQSHRAAGLDPSRQQKARSYARRARLIFLLELVVPAAAFGTFLASGLSAALGRALAMPAPLAAIVFLLAVMAGYSLLMLPVSYYRGFVLPHRYGLVTQRPGSWLVERGKRAVISLLLGSGMAAFAYWTLQRFPDAWWLLVGGMALFISLAMNILAPVVILPLFYKVKPLADGEMSRRITEMARRAGSQVFGVFTVNQSTRGTTVNAMLLGLGKTRRIVLSDGLFHAYTPDEVEVILAHEMGHHLHRDVPRLMLLQSAIVMIGFYLSNLAIRAAAGPLELRGISDVAGMPLLMLTIGAFLVAAGPLSSAYVRRLEGNADRWALRLTGKAEAFISVMTKLADQNLSEADPSRWAEVLFYDHPPYHRRVAMALSYQAEEGGQRSAADAGQAR